MARWLFKSEPHVFGWDDQVALGEGGGEWHGVRNYQARNFMRDAMQVGDGVLFYHSSCPEPGIAGLAEVASAAYPDASQFDAASPYFDARSAPGAPRWLHVDVRHRLTTPLLSLKAMRARPSLASSPVIPVAARLRLAPPVKKRR